MKRRHNSDNNDELNLKNFKIDQILNKQSREKSLILKGKFMDNKDDSVLILQKTPFPEELIDFEKSLLNDDYQTKNIMSNDIYETYEISGLTSINTISMMKISPATEKHIRKYSKPQFHMISESPLIYNTITQPFIIGNQFSNDWVINIIDGKAEMDRVLYRSKNDEFVIVIDFKWNGDIKDDLHCLVIGGKNAPRSLRDLRGAHLPMLREMLSKSLEVVSKRYDVPRSQLRLFFHYPPSFYHLHVHVTHLHNDSATALVDRAHALSAVIRNIETKGDFYQDAILDVTVQDNDPLYELYRLEKCFE